MRRKHKARAGARCVTIVSALLLLSLHPPVSCAELKIHFIDVGQGDCILVQCDYATMLVDAGPQDAGHAVNEYLKTVQGLSALDLIVSTHAHDDHLFGMPDALEGLSVGKVFAPAAVPMTYWFESVLPHLNQTGLELARPREYETVTLGSAVVTFLNTLQTAENPNDLSLVLRIDYVNTSVLLTADIEGEAEMHLLNEQVPLKADVLKVAHHGGNTSTSEAFLNAVDPQYAVISVGAGNKHGHPHSEPLRYLEKRNITIYRTDQFGTVIAISDGENWTFEVKKAR